MLMKLTVLTGFKVNMHCYRLITFLEMGKAVVLLFLLENLPDFNDVINTTLHTLEPEINGVSCNPTIIAPVLEVFGDKLGFEDSVERLLNVELQDQNKLITNIFQELSPEALYNIETVFDNSIENSMSLEKSEYIIDHSYSNVDGIINEDVSECEIPSTDLFKFNGTQNSSKVSFSESAPFLAAIFETVSNVTAQTCAGVLLSTHWVLTAASCINVLGPLYSNSSFQKTDHFYTIVIGATNPLKDGTVHNVSKIILHPKPTVLKPIDFSNPTLDKRAVLGTSVNVKTPSLALIRITPDVEESVLRIMENRTDWDGINARVYGWGLVQNQSEHDSMMATSLPVEMLSPAKCKINSILQDNSTFCLSMNETAGITRMTSGGPVVVIQDGRLQLLGVALSDGSSPLLASTVAVHRDWLHKTIGT